MIWHIEHVAEDQENDIRLVVHPVYAGQGEWVWHWAIMDIIDEYAEGPLCTSVPPGFKHETEAKNACDEAYRLQWLPHYLTTGDRDWPMNEPAPFKTQEEHNEAYWMNGSTDYDPGDDF